VGAAVDYSQGSSLRSAMQAAADAASLGTIKIASTLTPAQVQSTGRGCSTHRSIGRKSPPQSAPRTTQPATRWTLSAAATFKPSLMSMVG